MKKITVMGGGTGTFVTLSGLKQYPIDLGVIVNMMDSGGSTGRLRVQLGVLPPGDIRQCFVALSEAPELWRKLFLYRFENGDLEGHNFGNIFLSALEKVSENYDEVLKTVGYVLKTKGSILPVTYEKTQLCAEYESGVVVQGEGNIDENTSEKSRIKKAFLEPSVSANKNAVDRILESDMIVIGPGDLYTSIIPLLLVDEITEALKKIHGKLVYVVNLMTKSGQTNGYQVSDHINDLERYIGRKLDFILVHNGKIEHSIVEWYVSHHEQQVTDDIGSDSRVIRLELADNTIVAAHKSDALARSILRHDSKKLADALVHLIDTL